MRLQFHTASTLALLTILTCLVGCSGGSMAPVQGVVTLDGKPISGLEVNFEPTGDTTDRTTATGYTQPDGSYSLVYPGYKTGAPLGDYIVRIAGGESLDDGTVVRVPSQYNKQSELKATVTSGENKFDFDLTTK
ncbi:carboxypeptidase regulatory-like domain-containing protein [Bremerella sp. P1]|uniref:carboxypeptidase regulatory-like domain-containing protein n=1 Tax=Bremerella sp. P1 TaxID=3026424 RepID=UPI002367E864|nr:carboxypeptidase regulatory-like domain-containing protein [Bremerella sp. P1]WDI41375.1 carboxypeptidase regulatory-like domain-containing protein [Bremerella sp. P1]